MSTTVYTCAICNKIHLKKFVVTKQPKENTNPRPFCSIDCALKFLRDCKWKIYNIDGDRPEIEQLLIKLNLPEEKPESHTIEIMDNIDQENDHNESK